MTSSKFKFLSFTKLRLIILVNLSIVQTNKQQKIKAMLEENIWILLFFLLCCAVESKIHFKSPYFTLMSVYLVCVCVCVCVDR